MASNDDESEGDCLRSLLSQLEFRRTVRKYDEEGIPFRTFLYVPETDNLTGRQFHDREDHNHIVKVRRIKCGLRELNLLNEMSL